MEVRSFLWEEGQLKWISLTKINTPKFEISWWNYLQFNLLINRPNQSALCAPCCQVASTNKLINWFLFFFPRPFSVYMSQAAMISFCLSTQHWLYISVYNPSSSSHRSTVSSANWQTERWTQRKTSVPQEDERRGGWMSVWGWKPPTPSMNWENLGQNPSLWLQVWVETQK